MRSNNLLSSLLANSSANPRSNSLMHKEAYSNPYAASIRSSSVNNVLNQNKQLKSISTENNVRLVRLVHFLNLKVKNHYYFFFCKLEKAHKNHKKMKKEQEQIVDNCKTLKQVATNHKQSLKPLSKPQEKQIKKVNGLTILCDSFNTFKSKREILLQKQQMQLGFFNILAYSKKKQGGLQIIQWFTKQIIKRQTQVMIALSKLEKQRIRNQIFILNLSQIISKQKLETFEKLKYFVKSKDQLSTLTMKTLPSEIKKNEENWNQLKSEQQLVSKHQTSERLNRSKKIVLRQRKVSAVQPISFAFNKTKVTVVEDTPLSCEPLIKVEQKMIRCHNSKPDLPLTCLPDLNDNCHLFQECELPTFSTATTIYTMENYVTELREPSQLLCLTDRTMKKTPSEISKSAKNTPKYCKDKSSINLTLKKSVNLANPDQSPLAKIDQILNKIEQMKSYRSTEKSTEKKIVNVNVDKNLQIDQSAIKYRAKTSNQKFQESQKENFRERLITEKQKPVKKIRGLQSGSNYKSTTLAKSKQPKTEFTAKKMKMEIENIINKRNKQLYYRVESTQLN